jgi:hypothetical protein
MTSCLKKNNKKNGEHQKHNNIESTKSIVTPRALEHQKHRSTKTLKA